MTFEETRKAIEKYQKEHPLYFGTMLDVTAISSKEGADIISQTIERVIKKVDEDTELWCICEMAKMYMQGVRPVYPVRKQGEWIREENPRYAYDREHGDEYAGVSFHCSECGKVGITSYNFCPNCGADMRGTI